MTEFELKFEVSPANFKKVAAAMQQGKAIRQRLQANYFDTPDGLLAVHGVVVRLRKEGRRWVQTAKGPTADLLERLEHNVVLPQQPINTVPALDLSRHLGSPVGRLINTALGLKGRDNYPVLVMLYGTDVRRIMQRVAFGKSVVEVALDQGRVFAIGQSQAISELEVELKDGTPLDAVMLARQWCARHGLWMSTITKSMKGQRLRDTAPLGDAPKAVTPKFSPRIRGDDMLTAVVGTCLRQMLPNMSELAGGSNQAEHIHQLRVGIRRLRTALGELGGLTDAIDPTWQAALVQAFRALGAHRDHSYLALVVQPQLLAAGGPDMRFNNSSNNITEPGETVRNADFQDALLGLLGFVHRDVPKVADTPAALKKAISRRLEKLHAHALRDGKKFLVLDEAHQHGVRKQLKRLRYLMEFAAPLFAAHKVGRMMTPLKPVQDALGLYNDELMALHAWRALAADNPNAWFGIGWLTARRQPNAARCLKKIKAFAAIKPFWEG